MLKRLLRTGAEEQRKRKISQRRNEISALLGIVRVPGGQCLCDREPVAIGGERTRGRTTIRGHPFL